jgi:hypothetical protein
MKRSTKPVVPTSVQSVLNGTKVAPAACGTACGTGD